MLHQARHYLAKPAVRVAVTLALIYGAITAPIPFPWKVPTFAALALVIVWVETGSLEAIGLGKRRIVPTIGWAILGWAVVALGLSELALPVIQDLAGIEPDYSAYGPLKGNLEVALQLLAGAFISAMIAEEIVYRGFLLHQVTALLGDTSAIRAIAIVAGGIVFALPHSEQGVTGMAIVALTGMVLGWLFYRGGTRNLFIPMLAHALIDVWGISLLYLGIY